MDHDHADTPHAKQSPEAGSALVIRMDGFHDEQGENSDPESPPGRHWRTEMARWLLTLNPGRTQDEYAKAVRYFFETDGVPQDLNELSADLLLSYRGSLAMRAERGHAPRSARTSTSAGAARFARLWGRARGSYDLPGDNAMNGAHETPPASNRTSALAPATVNLRLTALRQFLRYASLRQPIENLTPERVQMALRRLPIERRRPYQILSEEEWPAFLAAARLPMAGGTASEAQTPPLNQPGSRNESPWGTTRAAAVRVDKTSVENKDQEKMPNPGHALRRARDGRTGAYTAQRDYALVALALTTGLRAIELSLLDVSDLTHERRRGHDEWWLTLPDEKTKGQRGGRTLPLAPELVVTLLDYLRSTSRSLGVEADRATPLFLALARGSQSESVGDSAETKSYSITRRLRPEQIRSVINRVETQWLALQQESADPSDQSTVGRRISPHALRHSAAIALLKGNETASRPPASVEHVRGWLGHFDIRTTQRYLDHLSSREERRKFAIAPKTTFPASLEEDELPDA